MIRHVSTKKYDGRRSEQGGGSLQKIGNVCICGACLHCRRALKEVDTKR